MKKLDPKRYGNPVDDVARRRMELGMMYERFLEKALAEHISVHNMTRPGELCVDGIYMTPDGYDPETKTVYEYKLTWKSMFKDPDWDFSNDIKHMAWRMQSLSYLKALNANRLILTVFWVNGNYKGYTPECVMYTYEPSEGEVERNWELILKTSKKMVEGEDDAV
jgi:hypothetical protein